MKLILVRHGETDFNAAGKNQGWLPSRLTPKGRLQADAAGKLLESENVKIMYCSDLLRTKETAEEIQKHVPAPIHYVPWLREKSLGVFEGKPEGTFVRHVQEHKHDLLSYKPEGGESILEFRSRVRTAYECLLDLTSEEVILLVTHGGFITQLLLHLLDIDDSEYDKHKPKHTAIVRFEIDRTTRQATRLPDLV